MIGQMMAKRQGFKAFYRAFKIHTYDSIFNEYVRRWPWRARVRYFIAPVKVGWYLKTDLERQQNGTETWEEIRAGRKWYQ